MRTADKIIRGYMGWSDTEVGYASGFSKGLVEKIINESRKEAIEECAERARKGINLLLNGNTNNKNIRARKETCF